MSTLKVKNGNTWIEIPAGGQGVPSGGTTGQFLRKSNSTDYATEWSTVTLGDVSSEDVVPVSKGGTGATTRIAAVQNLKTLDLMLGTEIPDNSDLNNYTTPGTYYCANGTSAATLSNIPSDVSVGFKLVVYYKGSNANINQELYPNGSDDFYIRYNQGSTWYNWKRVIDTSDLPLSIANGGTGTISAHSASNTLYTMYIHSPLTEIPANSDLNDYKNPSSTYYVLNSTVASTILNTPTIAAGYRLIVMYGTSSGNLRQIAIVNGGNETYSRHYTLSAGTWTDWGRLLDTNDLPISVDNGGTGASNAASARANLGDVYGAQVNITSGSHDLDDYKTPGMYYFSVGATITNSPRGAGNGWLTVYAASSGNNAKQIWQRHGSNPTSFRDFYMRLYTSGGWGDWARILEDSYLPISVANGGTGATSASAARTNLDLASVYAKESISIGDFGSAAKTISFISSGSGNYEPCLLVINGPSTVRQGLYIVALRRTSAPVVTPVVSASGVTITTETGKLKLTSSSAYTYGYLIPLSGALVNNIQIT